MVWYLYLGLEHDYLVDNCGLEDNHLKYPNNIDESIFNK